MTYQTGYGIPTSPPLGFGEALRTAWARKLSASGRARRSEFWWTQLGIFLAFLTVYVLVVVLAVVGATLSSSNGGGVGAASVVLFVLAGLVYLGAFVVAVVVQIPLLVRRLHDSDHSGWWVLIGFVPGVGGIVLLVFELLDGTPGPNRFGSSPAAVGGPGGGGSYPVGGGGYGAVGPWS